MSDARTTHLSRRRTWTLLATAALLYALVLAATIAWVQHLAIREQADSGRTRLGHYVSHLDALLARYDYLPAMLANDGEVTGLFAGPATVTALARLNRHLERINAISGASDIYLMDAEGTTVAASNWRLPRNFVGNNYSWRPYFREAIAGREGRYFALGSSSGRRGFYLSHPVAVDGEPRGVAVVKVDMEDVERGWTGTGEEVLVTDPDGVVFIATRAPWRLRTLEPLSAAARERIGASRRYADRPLEPLAVAPRRTLAGGVRRTRIGSAPEDDFLVQTQEMPDAGWRVHLLTPSTAIDERVVGGIVVSSSLYAALLVLALAQLQRHRQRRERDRCEARAQQALKEAHVQLERRVDERTAELRREVEERRNAEEALRHAQNELIQAAKLAVIGQLSAGVSHELNQPLAALRSYADNARLFLDREQPERARGNLIRIAELTDRMAQISSQLKLFARKTTGERVAVSLRAAIDAARRILRPQLRKNETTIDVELSGGTDRVLADPVRLEQVLVNLIANAVNAMEPQPERRLTIRGTHEGERIRLTIHDHGPGIPDENLARIFDPFFTTRESGLGLGLSISHRIVSGMGGQLVASNHPDGGAVFSLSLPVAECAETEPSDA